MGAAAPIRFEGADSMATGTYDRERELTAAITPAVESALPGVEVLAVELLSPARFCVYVDHPDGVDFALCERVTRLLDDYRSDWTIDVSSPGPERPIRRPEHFRRVIGGTVKLKTAGSQRVRGTLLAADDEAVTVSVNGTTQHIPVDEIVRGNLIDEGRES
jgi:ribosome maturation factor RimP